MDEEMGVGMSSTGSSLAGGFGGGIGGIGGGQGGRDLEGMEDGMMQNEQGFGGHGGVEDGHAELVCFSISDLHSREEY
jgi:hypothetical protein